MTKTDCVRLSMNLDTLEFTAPNYTVEIAAETSCRPLCNGSLMPLLSFGNHWLSENSRIGIVTRRAAPLCRTITGPLD